MVRVNYHSWLWTMTLDGHIERVDEKRGVLLGVDRPADQPTTVDVENGGAVEPAFARAVLCDVRDPALMRMWPGELPAHEGVSYYDTAESFSLDPPTGLRVMGLVLSA
ncbi:hypothetical protein GCM10011359_09490 [Nesterenkonia alkaliphila]|nr:hypothetical protein GCM10011359_09490 [Nesterenkonia alkaliphila]